MLISRSQPPSSAETNWPFCSIWIWNNEHEETEQRVWMKPNKWTLRQKPFGRTWRGKKQQHVLMQIWSKWSQSVLPEKWGENTARFSFFRGSREKICKCIEASSKANGHTDELFLWHPRATFNARSFSRKSAFNISGPRTCFQIFVFARRNIVLPSWSAILLYPAAFILAFLPELGPWQS